MYRTKNLILEPIVDDSWCDQYSWFDDQEVCKYNSHGKLTNRDLGKINPENNILWAVSLCGSRTHIGNIMLANINWIDRNAEFSCIFGEKKYWGKGYATEAAEVLFKHGFEKLNLHKIWLGTAAVNGGMIKVADNLGMEQEGFLKEHLFLEGQYVNCVMLGITRLMWNKRQAYTDILNKDSK